MEKTGFDTAFGEPGHREFGPYTVVRRLGVGGMAETYEAIRKGPGDFTQRVCLKLVLPFFRGRADFLTLFEREAHLAAKLRHSNVVGVIDFGEVDGITYIALELVDGTDLATLLDAQPGSRISPAHAALVGHDIAAALEHAHDPRRHGSADGVAENPIIHRDLSPSNVLVSRRGEILLTDFGVAKAITGTARQQSAVKGKVPYMSPEQLRSEAIDGRADLFALGVVLYESLGGQRPFQGDHDPATIMQILTGDRPPLVEVAPETPPGLAEVVEQLLEPDRDARPESATKVVELLDPYVPSPLERRGLGQLVADLKESQSYTPPYTPASGTASTEASGERSPADSGVSPTSASLAATAESAAPPAQPESRTSRRLGVVGVVVLALAAAIGLWLDRAEDVPRPATSAVEEERDAEESAAPTVDRPPSAVPGPSAVPSATSPAVAESPGEPPKDAQPVVEGPRPARVSVAVFPWGDVWIDGKPRGRAPVRNVPLSPGRHKVSAGQGEPWKTQVVRLKEGQRRSIQFDLSE